MSRLHTPWELDLCCEKLDVYCGGVMFRLILFVGFFVFEAVSACCYSNEFIEFKENELFIPQKLGRLKLFRDQQGFHILKDGNIYGVQNYFCDPVLRAMDNYQLKSFLGRNKPKIITITPEELEKIKIENVIEVSESEMCKIINQLFSSGYICVNQMDDGEYIIRAKMRLCGGVKEGVVAALKGGAVAATTSAGVGLGSGAAYGVWLATQFFEANIFSLPSGMLYLTAGFGIEIVAFPVLIGAGLIGAGYVGYKLAISSGNGTSTENPVAVQKSTPEHTNTSAEHLVPEPKSEEAILDAPPVGQILELNIAKNAEGYF